MADPLPGKPGANLMRPTFSDATVPVNSMAGTLAITATSSP
jgi:hypothetical protein